MSSEEFVTLYIQERNVLLRQESKNITETRCKFYAPDSKNGWKKSVLIENETERVISAIEYPDNIYVITSATCGDKTTVKRRYSVWLFENSWLIKGVEVECR